ncbi:MAG: vWA domain-containing protein [Opitutae bacterium]
MVKIALFLIFTASLLGTSPDSLKVVDFARSTLKAQGKVDLTVLSANGLFFVDSAEDVEELMKVLLARKEDSRLKTLVLEGMKSFRSKDSLDTMGKFAKVDRNCNEFTISLFLFHGLIPENDALWSSLIKSRDQKVAEVAINELGGSLVNSPKVADALIQRLKNNQDSISLKSSCIKKFMEVPTNKAASSLAWLLGNSSYKELALKTLTSTTGQSLGYDISKWQKWIRQNKQFTPNVLPAKEFPSREVVELRRRSSNQYPDRYQENQYPSVLQKDIVFSYPKPGEKREREEKSIYGIEIEGKSILFFLDCSGSMMGAPYQLLKEEILYMAETMDQSYSIGIVFFPFEEKVSVLEVSQNNRFFKNRLRSFLNHKKVGGPSPLLGAMQYAYGDLIENRYQPVDTLYIISDGHIGNSEARTAIYNLNAEKRLPIHTVCILGNTNFLNGVASDNGGKSYLVQ